MQVHSRVYEDVFKRVFLHKRLCDEDGIDFRFVKI